MCRGNLDPTMIKQYFPTSLLLWLLGVVLVLAPNITIITTQYIYYLYDTQRFLEIILLVATALLLVLNSRNREAWIVFFSHLSFRTKFSLSIFFLLGSISSTISATLPKYAFQELSLFALLSLLTIGIASQVHLYGKFVRKFLIAALFVGTVLISWHFVLDIFFCTQSNENYCLNRAEYFYRFTNHRFFNQFQSWTFPILALPFLLYSNRVGRWRGLLAIPSVVWWSVWLHSGGRGTGLALIVGSLAAWLIFKKRAHAWLSFQCLTGLAGVVLYFSTFYALSSSLESSIGILETGLVRGLSPIRPEMWLASLDMAYSNFLLGIGPQHYAFFHPIASISHPHSAIAQQLAEWGFPASSAAIFLLVSGLLAWIQITTTQDSQGSSNEEKYIPVTITASFFGALAHAQVSGVLVMPLSQIMGSVIIGLMLSYIPKKTITGPKLPSRFKTILFNVAVLSLACILLWSIFPQVNQINLINATQQPSGILHPRFWIQGQIDQY